ncbi:hypothetical protein ACNHYB_10880 [Isoptericola jiangsuensis]|uniref:hypothetical protein n=1 Tax=Isoptericola jiangsuensis TaxID=548579 RepID=UPI003AAF4B41
MSTTSPPRRTGGWEATTLRLLTYPANIVLGGLVAFVLAVPLVTLLPVAVALARALSVWHVQGDDAVVTSLLRELRATWRRTWRAGLVVGVAVALLVIDVLFLLSRFATSGAGLAALLVGAAVPVACALLLMLLLVPVSSSRDREGDLRSWAGHAATLVVGSPGRALLVLVLAAAVVGICVVLPTIGPFVLLSLPLDLAVRTWPAREEEPGDLVGDTE